MKKITAILMSLVMLLALASCGAKTDANTTTGSSENGADDAAAYVVGICQLVQHPALDAATQGFKDALVEKLGDRITFDEQNASNDVPTCSTIVSQFVSKNVDLIMANATPALTAAVEATDSIPIVATSITDYATALDISD